MTTWSKGQQWRVVGGLNVLNTEIRAYAPKAVPPATDANAWGSIADDAHEASSDHYPHYYPVLGAVAVVCARDFPHAPALGLDGGVVTEWLRVHRDPRISYVIFNGRIFSGHQVGSTPAWTWRPYTGKDKHDTHFHVSSVATAIADSTASWSLPTLEGASMASSSGITMSWGETLDAYLHRIEQLWVPAAQAAVAGAADAKAARVAIEALVTAINAGGGSVDSAAIIAHMDQLAAAELARDQAEAAAVQAQLSPAEAAQLGQH